DLVQPAPFNAADQSICGYLVVVEAELAGIDALITEFLELAADCESRRLLGDQQAHALVSRFGVRISFDQEGEAIPVQTVGDPGLPAINHVLAAYALGDRPDSLQIGAAVRFR